MESFSGCEGISHLRRWDLSSEGMDFFMGMDGMNENYGRDEIFGGKGMDSRRDGVLFENG